MMKYNFLLIVGGKGGKVYNNIFREIFYYEYKSTVRVEKSK